MARKGSGGVPSNFERWLAGQWQAGAWQVAVWVMMAVVSSPVAGFFIYGVWKWGPGIENVRALFGGAPASSSPGYGDNISLWVFVAVGVWWWALHKMIGGDRYKRVVLEVFAEDILDWRIKKMGMGGSAVFGGLIDEWQHEYKPGSVRLGRSMYDGTMLGLADDRGLLTIAASRSGKGRAAIIPNLIDWRGSVVVIDPKGTNAAVTAQRRGYGGGRVTKFLGQPVHVLDPFGIVPGVRSASFNPLAAVDLTGNRAKEDIGLIADALVVPGGKHDSYWDNGARTILAGVIAHLLSNHARAGGLSHDGNMRLVDAPAASPLPSLTDVRAALLQDATGLDRLFGAMMQNPVAGGLAKAAATQILSAGENERGSLFNSALSNTSWLDSEAMAGVMGRSDFTLADLKAAPTSVYVVLPPEYLIEHSRFLRLFVNLTVLAASRGGKSRVPVLLIMDEFFSLGALHALSRASGLLSGYGLKLWPILQNLSQLRELYPENWQTFFANAGAVQIFGVNDRGTAQEIVSTLGQAARLETIDARQMRVVNNLIEAPELEHLTERDTGLQVVLRSGKPALVLKKSNYDQDPDFDKSMYAPDPDHEGS